MSRTFDLIVRGGTLVTQRGRERADIGVRGGRIAEIGDLGRAAAEETYDAGGLHVLPGVIDSQVHFREPGLEHKEDLATGTAAAALGGVTAVFEMPNTSPATDTAERLSEKLRLAKGRAHVDHAFFIGATAGNAGQLAELESLPGCAGVKLFMGSSTGNLLVADDETITRVLANGRRRMAVHCEDEQRLIERRDLARDDAARHPLWRDAETAYRATERLLRLARRAGRRVHVLHVTTAAEMALLQEYRDIATVEVTPQHLTLEAPDCYQRLATLAQMNPPIRDGEHRMALWRALAGGLVDVIGSDHAPHSRDEKARPYPQSPYGMPGVQTLVPVMLDHVAAGRLSLEHFVDLTSAGVARIYGLAGKGRLALGYDADFTIVDLKARREITDDWIASKCGWTPFAGMTVSGWPVATMVRGHFAMRDGALANLAHGQPVRFQDTLGTARQ